VGTRRADAAFTYLGFSLEADPVRVVASYQLGEHRFTEVLGLELVADGSDPALLAAARWVALLAGVSYYKTGAPRTIDLGPIATTAAERAFLAEFYTEGLAEFTYRNGLERVELEFLGPEADPAPPVSTQPSTGRALVPFGGGIDSIVTLESTLAAGSDASLFICGRPGDRFAAIEAPAAVRGLPILRATRELDPQLHRSAELGFLNGHVPITGVLSALAVLAAVASGHDRVVMSNEHSASDPNLVHEGWAINHQWSKSAAFEQGFAAVLEASLGPRPHFSSFLRDRSELWVAKRFAELADYHLVFRSCNRAFTQDPARRATTWCGVCDKCCFIDLICSPYLPASTLSAIFGGAEPLEQPELAPVFERLVGLVPEPKPFECVGDVTECRAAVTVAARRADRSETTLLQRLAGAVAVDEATIAALLQPMRSEERSSGADELR